MEDKINYLYIMGASHSGSTLLTMLLNSHPEMTTIGELDTHGIGKLDGYRCSCRSLLTECPFWQQVREQMARYRPDFNLADMGTHLATGSRGWIRRLIGAEYHGPVLEAIRDLALGCSPTFRRAFAQFSRNSETLVKVLMELTGAKVFVDSSKLPHRLKFLLRVPAFDIKVIHIVRDGRAVALTYTDQDQFADASDPSLRRGGRGISAKTPYTLSESMERSAEEWRRGIRAAEHLLATLDRSRWLQVHYEDLCRDTEGTLTRIFEFAKVDPGRRNPDFRRAEHHIVGNGMRLDATSEIRLDDRWKTALSPENQAIFDTIAGKTNRRYGYQ
jgi:hypothetical protein